MTYTTIQKWGNSQGIRIPRHILSAAAMDMNEPLEIEVVEGVIMLKKAKPAKKSIQELFAGYEGNYKSEEVDWGEPAGEEVW